ncbi:MAG: DegV family protein [Anaerolineae bacterium]|nr:DegV family protein [Anaerolineae bacterium]
MIRIVTDSTCDLPDELLAKYRISVVPINIQFGQETYLERVTLSDAAFYRMVDDLKMIPTTSQPSLGQYQEVYRKLAAEPDTDAILSIHITSKLSGTYDNAVVAARQMPPQPPIVVFDSLSGSMGLGFMVLEAAEMAAQGASLEEITRRLEAVRERMHVFFTPEDLRYARMSGRVGLSRMLLVSALNIKLLLTVTEGKLSLFGRVRGRPKALQTLVDSLLERLADQAGKATAKLAVIHAQAPQAAEQVRQALLAHLPNAQVFVRDLSLGIAVHFGPGTVGVVGYNP